MHIPDRPISRFHSFCRKQICSIYPPTQPILVFTFLVAGVCSDSSETRMKRLRNAEAVGKEMPNRSIFNTVISMVRRASRSYVWSVSRTNSSTYRRQRSKRKWEESRLMHIMAGFTIYHFSMLFFQLEFIQP